MIHFLRYISRVTQLLQEKWACICFSPCSTCSRHHGTLGNDCYLLRTGTQHLSQWTTLWENGPLSCLLSFFSFSLFDPATRPNCILAQKAKNMEAVVFRAYALDGGTTKSQKKWCLAGKDNNVNLMHVNYRKYVWVKFCLLLTCS